MVILPDRAALRRRRAKIIAGHMFGSYGIAYDEPAPITLPNAKMTV
jgi:hypothetical protein